MNMGDTVALRLVDASGKPVRLGDEPGLYEPGLSESMEGVSTLLRQLLGAVEKLSEAGPVTVERRVETERLAQRILVDNLPSAFQLAPGEIAGLGREIVDKLAPVMHEAAKRPAPVVNVAGPPEVQRVTGEVSITEVLRAMIEGEVRIGNWPRAWALEATTIDKLASAIGKAVTIQIGVLASGGGGGMSMSDGGSGGGAGGTVNQGLPGTGQGAWFTRDDYATGEILPDQNGSGGVLTFTFSAPVQLVWVLSVGGDSRVDPVGGTPTAAQGIRAVDGVPVVRNVETSQVKVYSPSGAVVTVEGYRRV